MILYQLLSQFHWLCHKLVVTRLIQFSPADTILHCFKNISNLVFIQNTPSDTTKKITCHQNHHHLHQQDHQHQLLRGVDGVPIFGVSKMMRMMNSLNLI